MYKLNSKTKKIEPLRFVERVNDGSCKIPKKIPSEKHYCYQQYQEYDDSIKRIVTKSKKVLVDRRELMKNYKVSDFSFESLTASGVTLKSAPKMALDKLSQLDIATDNISQILNNEK